MHGLYIALLATLISAGTALFAAEKANPPSGNEIAKMAENARTAADHAAVAKAYRLRAESFAEMAEKYEAEVAKKNNGPKIGMESKWPAMSRNASQREKQKAISARRSARECEQLAAYHTQLAVEAGFAGSVEAKKSSSEPRSEVGGGF